MRVSNIITAVLLIAGMFVPVPSLSEEFAGFTLRGTLVSSQVNFFTGFREGRVKLFSNPSIYIVSCQTQECNNFLISSKGQHISTLGQAIPLNRIGSQAQEFLAIDVFGNLQTERATFIFTGVLSNYTPPHVSNSGLPEFDLTVNGNEVHHLICDPLYVGCDTRIQLSLGDCVAPVGDMESTDVGFLGDTLMYLWTTHIYTGQTCD